MSKNLGFCPSRLYDEGFDVVYQGGFLSMKLKTQIKTSGSGQTVIFQHGLASNAGQPQALLAGLEGAKIISTDCPGHGDKLLDAVVSPSFDTYTNYVKEMADEQQVDTAVWGGISMGAGIAINAALRFPNRVKALILVRPAWLDEQSPENLHILLQAAELMESPNGQTKFAQSNEFRLIQESLPKAAESILGVFASTQSRQLSRILKCMVRDRPLQRIESLNSFDRPSLIITNDNDPLHPAWMGRALHESMPGSRWVPVVSRYVDDVEHRAQVVAAVQDFLKSLN